MVPNHEYALAIPLSRLYERARLPDVDCRAGNGPEPSSCALHTVEAMLCPCIRGDVCVCRALACEFENRARRACGERSTEKEAITS